MSDTNRNENQLSNGLESNDLVWSILLVSAIARPNKSSICCRKIVKVECQWQRNRDEKRRQIYWWIKVGIQGKYFTTEGWDVGNREAWRFAKTYIISYRILSFDTKPPAADEAHVNSLKVFCPKIENSNDTLLFHCDILSIRFCTHQANPRCPRHPIRDRCLQNQKKY